MQNRIIGIVLIIVGIIMIAYTGFNYVTSDKLVDIGPIKINKEQDHTIEWSPLVGGALLVAGIAIVVMNKKKIA